MDVLIENIKKNLASAASEYYETGIEKLFKTRDANDYNYTQGMVGSLSISVELICKAIISHKCFPILFPSHIATKIFQIIHYNEIVGNSETNKLIETLGFSEESTVDFNAAWGLTKKVMGKSNIDFPDNLIDPVRKIRNTSVHSFLHKIKERDVETLAYVAIKLMFLLDDVLKREHFQETRCKKFIKDYDDKDIAEAQKKIQAARNLVTEKGKDAIGKEVEEIDEHDLAIDEVCVPCPICECDAVVSGEVSDEWEQHHYSDPPELECLTLIPTSFNCEGCELELSGYKQLNVIGLDEDIDISDRHDEFLESKQTEYWEGMEDEDL